MSEERRDTGQQLGRTDTRGLHEDVETLLGMPGVKEVFSTPGGKLFVTIISAGQHRAVPLEGPEFRSWLTAEFYGAQGRSPSSEAVSRARALFETRARFGSAVHEVFVRLGSDEAGAIYLDLGDPTGRAVRIDPDGWSLVDTPAVRFRRPRGLMPLPEPVMGGSIDELRPLINYGTEEQFILIVGWLVSAFQVQGPRPILILEGEQGSAKSWTSGCSRRLVDPNRADLRSQPKELRDLAISANNSLVLAFDNISYLSNALSDGLCRISTGGGFSTRALYTNDDEAIFEAQRPILLNGIDSTASRGDLLDRAILLKLPRLEAYRDERALIAEFQRARPRILGVLLTATATALREVGNIEIDDQFRMADAVAWITASEKALPWPVGSFLTAYRGNREEAVDRVIDSNLIGPTLVSFGQHKHNWSGTASELLEEVSRLAGEPLVSARNWPRTPWAFSTQLRRLVPDLRRKGLEVSWSRRGGNDSKRLITLEIMTSQKNSVTRVTRVTENPLVDPVNDPETTRGDAGDAGDADFGEREPWEQDEPDFPF